MAVEAREANALFIGLLGRGEADHARLLAWIRESVVEPG